MRCCNIGNKYNTFNEESRRERNFLLEFEVLVTKYRGKSLQKKSNTKDKSRNKFRGKSWTRKDVESYYCHKNGHLKRECRKLKREECENGMRVAYLLSFFKTMG